MQQLLFPAEAVQIASPAAAWLLNVLYKADSPMPCFVPINLLLSLHHNSIDRLFKMCGCQDRVHDLSGGAVPRLTWQIACLWHSEVLDRALCAV